MRSAHVQRTPPSADERQRSTPRVEPDSAIECGAPEGTGQYDYAEFCDHNSSNCLQARSAASAPAMADGRVTGANLMQAPLQRAGNKAGGTLWRKTNRSAAATARSPPPHTSRRCCVTMPLVWRQLLAIAAQNDTTTAQCAGRQTLTHAALERAMCPLPVEAASRPSII